MVTSVRAYQWPYTLYVFTGAAEKDGEEKLYKSTKRKKNDIFSVTIHVVRFEKWHLFVYIDKHLLKLLQFIIKNSFIVAAFWTFF